MDSAALVAFMGEAGLSWLLDEDRASWGLALAQIYALRGHPGRAAVYADSARVAYEGQINDGSHGGLQGMRHAILGLALAYQGRKAEAVRIGQRAVALLPTAKDAQWGPVVQHQLARIYMVVGEYEQALDHLERLLKTPYMLSPDWLRVDPNFALLRGNPRFERLVRGG